MPRRSKGPYLAWIDRRGCWAIRVNEHGSRVELSTGTPDRREAEAQLGRYLAERRALEIGSPRPPEQMPLATIFSDWLNEHAPGLSQPASTAGRMEHLLDFWGALNVNAVTPGRCSLYTTRRRAKASDGTIRRELGILRAALNHAVREGRLARAPFVQLPDSPPGRDRWLTRGEAARLLNAARNGHRSTRGYLPLFIMLALYTGARKGALLDLRWPQVDLERNRIDLNPIGRKRTNKGRATIPIPRKLRTFLVLAKRRGSDLGHVIAAGGHQVKDIKRAFASAVEAAGLADVTPHTLRHTCGTWLAQKAVPLFEIAGWLGQTSERTAALYAHHSPDHFKRAMAAMG